MPKHKPSGSAIFMYIVIALAVAITVVCFTLYYGGYYKSSSVLWTGVTAFTIMYHFWGRIIMGNVTMLFDGQFIVIQRFNRPRVLKVIEIQKKKEDRKNKTA